MKARSPAWIIIAAAVLLQGSGIVTTVGTALVGIDSAMRATIDLKKMFNTVVIAPIQPIVVPPTKKMPKKAPQK